MILSLFALFVSLALAAGDVAGPPPVDPPLQTGIRTTRDSALIIGNQGYQEVPEVPYAAHDADSFLQFLRQSRGLTPYRLRVLNDATASEMSAGLRRAVARVRRGGTLWIYFAGHGTISEDGRRILTGVDQGGGGPDLALEGLALDEVISAATRSRAGRVFIIVDAGFGPTGRKGQPVMPGREVPVPTFAGVDNANVVVWLAATGAEPAGVYEPARHGLFTWSVLGAFRGWADGALGDMPDGMVTLAEAQEYVNDVARRLGRYQVPSVERRDDVRDWVLAEGELDPGPSQETFLQLSVMEKDARLERLFAEAEERAVSAWEEATTLAAQGTDEGKEALEQFIQAWEYPILQMEWVQYVPEVRAARRMLERWGEEVPPLVGGEPPAGAVAAAPTGADDDQGCDDLFRLEDAALAGALSEARIQCLEDMIAHPKRRMTTKDKASRILLVDAEAKKDLPRWEILMKRHLEEIDQSDPDLCFKYTIYVSKGGADNARDVIHWSTRALERKDQWSGALFEKKVYALHRLRAEAATRLWNAAEQDHLEERSLQSEDRAEQFRGLAKEYSRSWLDYARVSAQETDNALSMCLAAAGAMDFCKED